MSLGCYEESIEAKNGDETFNVWIIRAESEQCHRVQGTRRYYHPLFWLVREEFTLNESEIDYAALLNSLIIMYITRKCICKYGSGHFALPILGTKSGFNAVSIHFMSIMTFLIEM